ncbi:PIG-L family deacetylase [Micromonospora sp. C28SCA-DRY-2]|uniref:PIG-L deacetylase family protein n=1 Tax=Micromonospora sp. C28SCA-DRY-2 TaxID=3059522 RepID=UPI0026743CA0|nr:PIG-L family deacetylase [Micromonospora sp. C28SCA-DRY-2]MDO3702484.1 PIG-L family deacetylase [Micromonospora sp. C28SCA-DRY-2]
MTFPAPAPARSGVSSALAVFAHPDDTDFGCAGTIASWVDEGIEVAYLTATRGGTGRRPATAATVR